MSKYIPFYAYPDRMPVDISFVFKDEKPSGRHGFCKADGDKLRFEDGTLAKFWGVICNGASNFGTHENMEKMAVRLAQAGCNIVRWHQLDAEWATPNLYRLTAGKYVENTRELCPESMERLDYWIKCLKENGLYITVDMTTYRKFKTGDGVKFANLFGDNAKLYAMYDPTMIELQKEFCTNFWNHKNPYTGLCYKDDPVFVMVDITNENDLFTDHSRKLDWEIIPYYEQEFREMFAAWLKEQGIEYDAFGCPFFNTDKPMTDFRIYLHRKFCEEMYAHLRSLGVKVPITGTNWAHTHALLKAQENMDFGDAHCYVTDWVWSEKERIYSSGAVSGMNETPLKGACTLRLHGKPMFMTEWDVRFPNPYRAEGPAYFPAFAQFQGWSGMCIHTYGYNSDHSKYDLLGKESSSSTVGSIPFREGIFTVWNDPAQFGLFYHGALILRRGDVREAEKTVGARITPENYTKQIGKLPGTAGDLHRVEMVLDTTDTSDLDEVLDITESYPREDPEKIVSDTGELWRIPSRRIGAVDTPRTKIVYGSLGRSGYVHAKRRDLNIRLDGMTVDPYCDFGVIALSSLTDEPICESKNMLLSAIGRARNTDQQMDGDKLLDFGRLPITAEVIDAVIELKTSRKNLRVWGVNSEGYYVGRLDVEYGDGCIRFHIGPDLPALYYLIMDE